MRAGRVLLIGWPTAPNPIPEPKPATASEAARTLALAPRTARERRDAIHRDLAGVKT
jgi:hypothetical protein